MIDRPDWEPAPAPVAEPKAQSIPRPDWHATPQPAVAAERRDGIIQRADWTTEADEADEDMVAAGDKPQPEAPRISPVETALDSIPLEYRVDFEAGFDDLPEGVTAAISDALSMNTSQQTDMSGVDNFSQTDEGAALVSEWGPEAQQKIGLIQTRLMQIEAEAAPGEVAEMWDWYDDLPSHEARAVLRALAG